MRVIHLQKYSHNGIPKGPFGGVTMNALTRSCRTVPYYKPVEDT